MRTKTRRIYLQLSAEMCKFVESMIKRFVTILLAVCALAACRKQTAPPRPTIGLVESIAGDTTGLRNLVAGVSLRPTGSIALIGDPADVITLARRFQGSDQRDNIDGREHRDSLADFAGETFDAILDAYNAPYAHFMAENSSTDSLREVAVTAALAAWDTTCNRLATDHKALLRKASAKMLIFTSSLQEEYGLFDVDTLLQLTGGKCKILTPVNILLENAIQGGALNIAVWASRPVRQSRTWEHAFEKMGRPDVRLHVFTPEQALDVRTQLRNILRQYQTTGLPLDALIIDSYSVNLGPLRSELDMIRRCGTEEDAAFDKMLSARFGFYEPADAFIRTTYEFLRKENLFSHRIARPQVKYYETAESDAGHVVLVEAAASYVQNTYVSELH